MRCILYNGTNCLAVGFPEKHLQYEPTAEEQEGKCNGVFFRKCPRFVAYLEVLQSKQAKKKEIGESAFFFNRETTQQKKGVEANLSFFYSVIYL